MWMYVENLRVVFGGILGPHKVHAQEQTVNMDTKKLGVVELLDKYEVVCCDEDVVAYLYQGVLVCLDKNNKDDFDVYFLYVKPLE